MKAFIKSQDEKAWRSILSGWSPLVEKDDEGNTKVKPELEWSKLLSGYNNKAFHAIFNGVGEGFIKLISSCDSEKEAWLILQTQFEGTADVKRTRFTMLQTKFDELRMKIVRVLSDRFDTKLLAVEEAKDFGKMKVEELMSFLRTFELNQQIKQKDKPKPPTSKNKSAAFKISEKECSNSEEEDEMALECEGFGHIQSECANTLKKNKKGLNVIWSDDDSDSSDNELSNVALTSTVSSMPIFLQGSKEVSDTTKMSLGQTEIRPSGKNLQAYEKHMTGDRTILTNIRPMQCGTMTFGNCVSGNVIGMGTLNYRGLPHLKNIMLVEGLKANLLSISQICDQGYIVNFDRENYYVLNFDGDCILEAIGNNTDMWHEKLGRINFKTLKKLSSTGIVRGFPRLGKESLDFLREKSDTFDAFKTLCLKFRVEKDCNIGKIDRIRSDLGKAFENSVYDDFCKSYGITHEFSAPKTLEQNGVVERKNRTLHEMARVMLNSKKLTKHLWAEAINTACYTINRVFPRPGTFNTSYGIWKEFSTEEEIRSHLEEHSVATNADVVTPRAETAETEAENEETKSYSLQVEDEQ
ncbi:uncharacterized protein LOC133806339 [Humulus lupulus]|uniref:uncharacterized protein LOC133806339 n=1 Tax=Humulus lupulus TaxID=3486 RepID=UPI002B40C97F|nr:uncharacterized protein LOC133806339 [Humulus lupulus]